MVTGVEARESFLDPCIEGGGASARLRFARPTAGAGSSGEEWSRPKVGRGSPLRVSLRREFTVPS